MIEATVEPGIRKTDLAALKSSVAASPHCHNVRLLKWPDRLKIWPRTITTLWPSTIATSLTLTPTQEGLDVDLGIGGSHKHGTCLHMSASVFRARFDELAAALSAVPLHLGLGYVFTESAEPFKRFCR